MKFEYTKIKMKRHTLLYIFMENYKIITFKLKLGILSLYHVEINYSFELPIILLTKQLTIKIYKNQNPVILFISDTKSS